MISDQAQFDRLEDDIAEMIADLEFYTYHQLLDVRTDARPEIVLYNFNVKVHEYRQLQAHKRCTASLYQHIELLIDRLDEAREVLCDRRLAMQYARGLDLGNMRHPRIAAERDARRPASEPLAIDNRVQDEALERRASQLEEQLEELIHAPDEEVEEVSRGIDEEMLEQEATQLAEEVNDYGIRLDAEDVVDEEEVPIDEEFLEEAEADLRQKLIEDHVSMNEDAHLTEDVAPDAAFAEEAVSALSVELASDGVDLHAEDVEPDVTPDFEYTDEAVSTLERELVEDGVFVHELVADEDPLAAVDHEYASEAVDRLRRELKTEHRIDTTERSERAAQARERQEKNKRAKLSDALNVTATVEEALPSIRALPGDPPGPVGPAARQHPGAGPGGLDAVSTDPDPQRAPASATDASTPTEPERPAQVKRAPRNAAAALEAAQASLAAKRAVRKARAGAAEAADAATAAAASPVALDGRAAAGGARTVVHADAPTQLIGRLPPRVWQRRGGPRPALPLAPAAAIDVGERIALVNAERDALPPPRLPDLGEPIEL